MAGIFLSWALQKAPLQPTTEASLHVKEEGKKHKIMEEMAKGLILDAFHTKKHMRKS